jgi:hypothetical protein
MLQTYFWFTQCGSNVSCNYRTRVCVCVCPSCGSTRSISLLPVGHSASCFQNPLWFCHRHAPLIFTGRVACIVAFLLEKSHLWFSCTWPLMAYYKPTILQLFQADLEEGTTTFQRAEESMSVNKLTGSRQTDWELTVLYSTSKLLTPYPRLFLLKGSQSAVLTSKARSLKLSSMFAYRWCVNKQLQQL